MHNFQGYFSRTFPGP